MRSLAQKVRLGQTCQIRLRNIWKSDAQNRSQMEKQSDFKDVVAARHVLS